LTIYPGLAFEDHVDNHIKSRFYIGSALEFEYNLNPTDEPSSLHASANIPVKLFRNPSDGNAWYYSIP